MPLVVGGGVAVLLWLPKLVRGQVAARLQARTGLPAKVSEVSLGFGSVALQRIELGAGAGPHLLAKDITFEGNPLSLALRGSRGLRSVHVGELDLRVPVQSAQAKQRMLARRHRAHDAAAERATLPALRVDHMQIELGDAAGELVQVRGGPVQLDDGGARVELQSVRLGAAPASVLELERIGAQAAHGPKGLALRRMRVASAKLRLAAPRSPPAPPASAAPGAAAAPTPAPALTTWQRLRALARQLAPGGPPRAPSGAAAQRKPGSGLLERLAGDAALTLEDASVRGGAGGAPILQGLRATLAVKSGGALAFAGSGKAQGGGIVHWDLSVHPQEARADGQVELRSLPLSLLAPFLPSVPWYEPEAGRVDAELVIKTEPAQGIAFSGSASLTDAAISSPRISAEPVRGIDVTLRGKGRFLPLAHRLEIAQGEIGLGEATLNVSGAVEWSADHYLFDIDASLPPTPCTKAVQAIPEDLLGDMVLATWQGKLAGHLRLKLDSRALDDTVLTIEPVDHCEFVTVPALADLRRFRMPFIHSVEEPDGTLFEMETGPGTPEWTFLEDISPFFVHAVLAHEDAGFFSHHGFSPRHIREALIRDLKEGRYVVGASTITMQLVKNVFLHREKTLARKIQEVLLTWWIERVMDKRDIIELYLNVIEFGPSVYGIRNAARHYFNRLPSQLSPAESIFLATILPNPKRYHSFFERGALSPAWIDQMRHMLLRMRERGWYSPEAVDYGLKELQNFRFVPEGTIVAPRQIPGHAAPLPYMQSYAQQPGWGEDSTLEPGPGPSEDGSFEAPKKAKPVAAPGASRPQPPRAAQR